MTEKLNMAEDLNVRRKRILFQARHRGTKEADLLIGRFVEAHLAGFDVPDLDALEAVMAEQDLDLVAWIIGGVTPPPTANTPMLARIIAYHTA